MRWMAGIRERREKMRLGGDWTTTHPRTARTPAQRTPHSAHPHGVHPHGVLPPRALPHHEFRLKDDATGLE